MGVKSNYVVVAVESNQKFKKNCISSVSEELYLYEIDHTIRLVRTCSWPCFGFAAGATQRYAILHNHKLRSQSHVWQLDVYDFRQRISCCDCRKCLP